MVTETSSSTEERLARIERSVERIASQMDQAPTFVSMATDSIDEIILDAKEDNVDVDVRLKDGIKLLKRLSDPGINSAIRNLLDAVEKGPGLVSMVTDAVDIELSKANSGRVTIDDRIKNVLHLLNHLAQPETKQKIDELLTLTDRAPGLMAMGVDMVDSFMEHHGKELQENLSFLHRENLLLLKSAGEAFTEAQNEPPAKVGGIFALLKAIKEPGRQRALGFLMNVLKNLGQKI